MCNFIDTSRRPKWIRSLSALAFGLILVALFLWVKPVNSTAAPLAQEPTPVPNLSIGDDYCLSCHGQPGQTMTLEDGSTLDLFVEPRDYHASIHGELGYACVQCHRDVGQYPHPAFTAADRRDVSLKLYQTCQRCHTGEYSRTQDSVHARAMGEGKREAAICTDCHTAHAVQRWVDPQTRKTLDAARTAIPQTCALCHNAIYQKYRQSVHGAALTDENNPDVPTCIDCHGVHNIENPTTPTFRLKSPEICARCHTDPARVAKYGLSTQVLNTYVADFHGTTVSIFEKQSPDAETNKPVCYDCHGVHEIKRADDPEKGLQVKANLLVTCQKCHPNAAENFPAAWLSHYIPSPEKYPMVYYVNLFYTFFIPGVLGSMGALVVLDFTRRVINWRRMGSKGTVKTGATVYQNIGEALKAVAQPEAENEQKPAQPITAVDDPIQSQPEASQAEGPPEEIVAGDSQAVDAPPEDSQSDGVQPEDEEGQHG